MQSFRFIGRCLAWLLGTALGILFLWGARLGATEAIRTDQPITELKGPWELYWQKFLAPTDPVPEADAKVLAGKAWNGLQLNNGAKLSGQGWATYRLILDFLPSDGSPYHLKIPDVSSAARIYLFPEDDPTLVYQARLGQVSSTLAGEVPSRHSQALSFTPNGRKWIVLIQVSNHFSHKGGLWKVPTLGPEAQLRNQERLASLVTSLALGIVLAIGIYSLLIWIRNRLNLESLCLFGVSLGSILRSVSVQDSTMSLLPEGAYHLIRATEYATLFLGPLGYYLFLQYSFFPDRKQRYIYHFTGLGLLLSLIPLLTPQSIYGRLLPLNQIFLLILLLLCIWDIGKASWRRAKHAGLAVAGIAVIILGFVVDYGYASGYWNTGFYSMPLCIAVFLLLQAQIVAAHSADAFAKAKYLSEELREKEKARTLFFHNTSHELRTPLNGIIGFLDLVRQGHFGSIAVEARQQIEKALRLAESLKTQVNTILDLAKSRRGELSLRHQRISLIDLYKDACNLSEGLCLRSAGLSFQAKMSGLDQDFIGDRDKVFTILRNLLGNAFKFRDPSRSNEVVLDMQLKDRVLEITVSDTGIGIPLASQETIFDEFAQVQGDARRGYEGTGLGLTMVRDLVALMQGQIHLQSEPGVGSQFKVTITSAPSATIDQLIPEEKEAQSESSTEIHSDTIPQADAFVDVVEASKDKDSWEIYVIDDNETNCEVISGMLKIDGYQVRTALSGRIGLSEMKEKRPDVLLLDMMMPEMSGEDVLAAMRKDPLLQDIPVVLITARASEEDRIEGLKLGADDYLAKPIFAAELRLRVRNMIYRHKLLRQTERMEQDDKLMHLGLLFADLSHELKNIFIVSGNNLLLREEDGILSAAVLNIAEDLQVSYGKKLIAPPLAHKAALLRLDRLQLPDQKLTGHIAELARYLVELDLEWQELEQIWEQVSKASDEEIFFALSQAKIFYQYRLLMNSLNRARDLTSSVLSFTRSRHDAPNTPVNESWQQAAQLLQSKLRMSQVRISLELGSHVVDIPASRLIQVFVNLIHNALDALKDLPDSEQWIEITSKQEESELIVRFSNGGPPIEEKIQDKIFNRGFTTKGEKGSGIGLFVCQRILQEAKGDISLDTDRANPSFVLRIPLVYAQKN